MKTIRPTLSDQNQLAFQIFKDSLLATLLFILLILLLP